MKICYIMVNNCIFSKLLVNNLNKLGNEVFLITNNLDKDLNVKQYILNRGIPYGPKESMFRFAFSPLSILKVRKIIEKEKPDIIHAHYSLHAGLIASLATKRRFILSCWGSDIYMGLPGY
ncbi:glycosyltransferase [Candidatus Woesearchaeota archaeon]|nr:glycosyltransferase [Candidatus Woesearchaeota archaeon]